MWQRQFVRQAVLANKKKLIESTQEIYNIKRKCVVKGVVWTPSSRTLRFGQNTNGTIFFILNVQI